MADIEDLEDLYEEVDILWKKITTLFDAIKHGDEAHQAWLKEKIEEHFYGRT